MPDYAPRLYIHDVKILHYSALRLAAQSAKTRMYSVLENALSTGFPLTRRNKYAAKDVVERLKIPISLSPSEWFTGWEELGIDMWTIVDKKYSWQDFEVLKYFHKYGLRRFWIDDIWEFDWEQCRLYAKSLGMNDIPDFEIKAPPKIVKLIFSLLTKLYIRARPFIK